jgi:hypothetical protein
VHDLLDCLVRNNTCDMKRELLGIGNVLATAFLIYVFATVF